MARPAVTAVRGHAGMCTSAGGPTVAIAGVTGAVGQDILQVLDERKFPVGKVRVRRVARGVCDPATPRTRAMLTRTPRSMPPPPSTHSTLVWPTGQVSGQQSQRREEAELARGGAHHRGADRRVVRRRRHCVLQCRRIPKPDVRPRSSRSRYDIVRAKRSLGMYVWRPPRRCASLTRHVVRCACNCATQVPSWLTTRLRSA